MAVYDLTQGIPSAIVTGDILNCPYSGQSIPLILPRGKYQLECWGADGGYGYTSETYHGGAGGFSTGILTLQTKTQMFLYAGGRGANGGSSSSIKAGGFNGGGNSGYNCGGSGGGSSDIRIEHDTLFARLIVAGGGGGGCYYSSYYGGAGGGENGAAGTGYNATYNAKGATQTTGGAAGGYSGYQGSSGAFGIGGNASTTASSYNPSGGGGGGWYGGGGGGYRSSFLYSFYGNSGGGGGSGFVWTGLNAPEGYLLDETYYLSEASTITGNTLNAGPDGSGDGYIRITVIEAGIPMLLISSPSIVPGTVETQEAYTVSVTVTEVLVELTGTEAAFEFPFENRYLDLFDLIVEEVTYEIQS